MKKVYIKPEISTEIIEVELPISASTDGDNLPVFGNSDKTIDSEADFLTKDRNEDGWGSLW